MVEGYRRSFSPKYDRSYLASFIANSRSVGNIKAAQLQLFDVLEDDGRPGLRERPVDGVVVVAAQVDHQSAAVRHLQHLTLCPVFLILAATKRTLSINLRDRPIQEVLL